MVALLGLASESKNPPRHRLPDAPLLGSNHHTGSDARGYTRLDKDLKLYLIRRWMAQVVVAPISTYDALWCPYGVLVCQFLASIPQTTNLNIFFSFVAPLSAHAIA